MTQSSSNTNEIRGAKERGGAHYASKRFAEAISAYTYCIDHAASEDSELYLYYSNRCACYMQMNEYVRAKGDAESCISLKPTFSKGYSRLGNCLLKLNKVQEAVYAFERCSELDPSNYEAANALSRARDLLSGGSSRGGYGHSSSGHMSQLTQLLATAKQWCARGLTQGLLYWNGMTSTQRQIAGGFVAAILVYFLFFSGGGGYDSYSSGYGGGYGYGGGLSWTVWGALMAAGYYVPPLLVDVIGPQYARPYFGMSWTTFMWLLNMVGNRTGGMGGMGGMGGGLGGLFGRRRRYNY